MLVVVNFKLSSLALLCGAFALLAGLGFAAEGAEAAANAAIGGAEVKLLEMVLTGPLGFTLGLAVVAMGIWQFAQQNNGVAITMVLAGVLITLAPGIYNGARTVVCPITQALGYEVKC